MHGRFQPGTSGNPKGRPHGATTINQRRLRRAFNRAVEPHAEELMERAIAQALNGDREALAGLLRLIGAAMSPEATQPTV